MNFQVTASRNSVLLMVYRWLLERRLAFNEYDRTVHGKIYETRKPGAKLNICPIVWSIVRGIFITMPLWIGAFIIVPLLIGAVMIGSVCLLFVGGYQEFAGRFADTFDVVAALKVAGIVVGVGAVIFALRMPLFYLMVGIMIAIVSVVMGVAWVVEKISPALALIGNFAFGKIPTTKKKAPSGTLAVLGAWVHGQYKQYCPTLTVTA